MGKLSELPYEELKKQIAGMETDLLFAELEDAVQYDIAQLSNTEWLRANKKVYVMLTNELRRRLKK